MRPLLALAFVLSASIAHAQVPDHTQVVHQVAVGRHLGSHEANCAFTHAVAVELHAMDPRFGLLNKRPGQNQCPDATAVDAVLFLPPFGLATAVDIIVASDSPGAHPGWTLDEPRYSAADWRAPVAPNPGPAPTPNPPPVDTSFQELLLEYMARTEQWQTDFRTWAETEIKAVRAEHAEAVEHHEQDDADKPGTPWMQIILGILAAIGGAAGAVQ